MDSTVTVDTCEIIGESISVQIGFRPRKLAQCRQASALKIIKRDNRIVQAHSLPTILNFNMRSFFPKHVNFCDDIEERQGDVAFLTEIWEKKGKQKAQNKNQRNARNERGHLY